MKMMMLLLVSAAALLVSLAAPSPSHHENLKRIIDLAEKYNRSLAREIYVEDVRRLYEDGCGDEFFCKVYDVLEKHENFSKRRDEEELVRNLKKFIHQSNLTCAELLPSVTPSTVEIKIPQLVDYLIKCSQRRNFSGVSKSNR